MRPTSAPRLQRQGSPHHEAPAEESRERPGRPHHLAVKGGDARDEVMAAMVVEGLAPKVLNRPLGARTERDARDESGLRVDFTYDDCSPPAALEITGIHAPEERQLSGEIDKRLEPDLTALAREERLGSWLIVLDATADVKRLMAELPGLMRSGTSFRPGDYSSDELLALPREAVAGFVDRHRRFQSLGLVEIELQAMDEHGVRCMAFGIGGELSGFQKQLSKAISENARKLGEAGNREKHLAVFVYDFRASRLVERTPLPGLPPEVDYLWVIHTWPRTPGRPEVWIGQRGDSAWTQEIWSAGAT